MEKETKVSKTKATTSPSIRPSTSNPVLRQTPSPTPPARASKSNIVSGEPGNGQKRPSSSNNLLSASSLPGLPTLGNEENVRVVVRVRPLSQKEEEKGCREVVIVHQSENGIELRNPALELDREPKSFAYDAVFGTDTAQAELYNQVARPIVANVIEGYNGTIFAYGQTGTGKTFTMEGSNASPELKGVIPNSFAQIFSHVSQASADTSFLVRVSYMEIYNEDVRDLLSKEPTKKLDVKESFDLGVYVKDLQTYVVDSENDMERIMRLGNKNRSVGSTNMNLVSSRSHAIFSITVESSIEREDGDKHVRMGKLNLVDLAGSERVSKTGATGDRLKEGAKINLSLSCLGNVIAALVDGETHIPYRNSKLTRLLQDSLGGNARTIMIANIGPADYNFDETLGTLRYADRAKHIKNRARINEDPKDALLRKFENEIEELKRLLALEDVDPADIRAAIERSGGPAQSMDDLPLSSEAEDDEEEEEEQEQVVKNKMSEETILKIKGELEGLRQSEEQMTAAAGDGQEEVLGNLQENLKSWKQHEKAKLKLEKKLRVIRRKIIIGGDILIKKSREQEKFLQQAMKKLEAKKEEQRELQVSLSNIVAEKAISEDRIMQIETISANYYTRGKKLWEMYEQEMAEDDAIRDELQYVKDAVVEDIRHTLTAYSRVQTILDFFIPNKSQKIILSNMTYNEDNDCWSLPCIAYSGNNIEFTDQETEENSYLYGLAMDPGRQRHKMKRIDSDFRSIYDSEKPMKHFQDLEDFEEEIAKLEEDSEVEYVEGCEKTGRDGTIKSKYYDEEVEPETDDELEPEQFYLMQQHFPLCDASEIFYRGLSKKRIVGRQTSHKKKVVEKSAGFTGDYGYGYDPDFA